MSEMVFLVTSAINTSTGIIPVEVRLQQTLDTAKSIKVKIPNARIILLEGGYTPLNFAAANGNFVVAKLLIEKGAAVSAKNNVCRYITLLSLYHHH